MIKHIRIQNFRSLVDVSVDLAPLTVLIGRSGTGKSNFVQAIRFLRNLLSQPQSVRTNILPAHLKQGTLGYTLRLEIPGYLDELEYSLQLPMTEENITGPASERLTSGHSTVFHQDKGKWVVAPGLTPIPQPHLMVLRHLSGIREATITHAALNSGIGCYDFPGSVLQTATAAQPQKQAEYGTGFRDDGSDFLATATSIINNLERLSDWDTITESLRAVNRAVKNIDLSRPGLNRLEIALGLNGRLMRLDSSQESEGFRRFLAHMLALYQSPPKQTLIFEHPEHGIHPGAMTALFEEFEAYVNSGRGQIILTTHSPQLLDHFKPENIRVVEMVGQETQIGPLAPEQAEALRDDLLSTGELLTVDPARLKGQLAEVPG